MYLILHSSKVQNCTHDYMNDGTDIKGAVWLHVKPLLKVHTQQQPSQWVFEPLLSALQAKRFNQTAIMSVFAPLAHSCLGAE